MKVAIVTSVSYTHLSKQSPTVGMFFMAPDYIKFVSDLKAYTTGEIRFIDPQKSRWKDVYKRQVGFWE